MNKIKKRNIKFKAWYESTDMMMDIKTIEDLVANVNMNETIAHRLIYLQQTPFKDAAGVDIFEGDILAHSQLDENLNEYEDLCVVFWNDDDAQFQVDCSKSFDQSHSVSLSLILDDFNLEHFPEFAYKVKGNIYENPEFLKK